MRCIDTQRPWVQPDTLNSRVTGPTPLPAAVLAHINQQMLSHRSEPFKRTYRTVSLGLMEVLGCAIPPLLFSSSGTAALEATVLNLVARGHRVLAISSGYYGDLFAAIARRHLGEQLDLIRLPPGDGVSVEVLEGAPDALVLVDAVSSVGTTELRLDQWGIDAAVAVTQKGLMAPPGMSIVACSERALARASSGECIGSVAFDFSSCLQLARKSQTLTTPSLHAFWGLEKSLSMLLAEGLESVYRRHAQLSGQLRSGLEQIGLKVLARREYVSPAITAARLPRGIDSARLCAQLLERYSLAIGVGMGELQSQVVRVGHMGNVCASDIAHAVESIQQALADWRSDGDRPVCQEEAHR